MVGILCGESCDFYCDLFACVVFELGVEEMYSSLEYVRPPVGDFLDMIDL